MKKRVMAALCALLLLSGCAAPVKAAGEPADGFDLLGGSWVAAGFVYEGHIIDLSDDAALMDIYDTVLLSFDESGTFLYMNGYNARGQYIRQESEDTFLLKTDTRFTYDLVNGELAEKEMEGDPGAYRITLLEDGNTFVFFVADRETGKAKEDADPLFFEREDHESEFIAQNKTPLHKKQEESVKRSGIDSAPSASKPTSGQRNALESAKAYLRVMPFSRAGLVEQLEYEGYSSSEARYGVEHCGADWYEQAVKSAESYLDVMPFSRSQLIEQLEYEGFTHEQAVYGVDRAY